MPNYPWNESTFILSRTLYAIQTVSAVEGSDPKECLSSFLHYTIECHVSHHPLSTIAVSLVDLPHVCYWLLYLPVSRRHRWKASSENRLKLASWGAVWPWMWCFVDVVCWPNRSISHWPAVTPVHSAGIHVAGSWTGILLSLADVCLWHPPFQEVWWMSRVGYRHGRYKWVLTLPVPLNICRIEY